MHEWENGVDSHSWPLHDTCKFAIHGVCHVSKGHGSKGAHGIKGRCWPRSKQGVVIGLLLLPAQQRCLKYRCTQQGLHYQNAASLKRPSIGFEDLMKRLWKRQNNVESSGNPNSDNSSAGSMIGECKCDYPNSKDARSTADDIDVTLFFYRYDQISITHVLRLVGWPKRVNNLSLSLVMTVSTMNAEAIGCSQQHAITAVGIRLVLGEMTSPS